MKLLNLKAKKGAGRNIQRKARKRGGPSSYRGLSHEQVCIVTTTDRNGHEIFKAVVVMENQPRTVY